MFYMVIAVWEEREIPGLIIRMHLVSIQLGVVGYTKFATQAIYVPISKANTVWCTVYVLVSRLRLSLAMFTGTN